MYRKSLALGSFGQSNKNKQNINFKMHQSFSQDLVSKHEIYGKLYVIYQIPR